MRGIDPLKVGDRVLTSGDGGLLPRGLPVGVAVRGVDGAWRVKLDSDDAPIDFVRILLFRSFDQVVDRKALASSTVPPLPASDMEAPAGQSAAPPAGVSSAPSRPTAAPKPAPPPAKPETTP